MNLTDLYCSTYPVWNQVMDRAEQVARTNWPLLLAGPRGSGKTRLARYIHDRSGRTGAFVLGPAPSIPEGLLQGELLGHVRGAFTDAQSDQQGLIALAHRGTFFIDEIEAASYAFQALLVGQVEQAGVRRMGEARPRDVDVRFMYASNADLKDLAANKQFRADLLDRIGGLELRVPALAEYRGAIGQLAEGFTGEYLAELGRAWAADFSFAVMERFLTHSWPGNLRELRNVCREIALRLTTSRTVIPDDLPTYLLQASPPVLGRTERQIMRDQIEGALKTAGGNKSAAARAMAVSRNRFTRLYHYVTRPSPAAGLRRPS